ncbi:cyclin-C1-1 isoform X3 [Physcomitrium patens]|uniref:Cyclin-like domain-containing protein n=1 Tax=Physcomitrium patens TaxID=3218 RepID=A0A7I4CEI8_PHYPA|nr:cyclin-C1-1-like isoform X3 [Physcomitrium patens]|eukprot:XP_024362788.1 cyclin-C1-1-like isoform X3 [Physcomitrella patens]
MLWECDCSKKLLDQEEVSHVAQTDAERGLTPEDVKLMKIQFSAYIKLLGYHAKVRQRVVATAIAYFRRIYTRKSFSEFDPRLVAPTCLYLASKAEESTVQAKLLVFCTKKIRATFACLFTSAPDEKAHRYDVKDILEMEMRLLEALDYYLVIYHPYRPLIQLLQDGNMPTDMTQFTWSLVNDSYRTDLILMYPPFMIALACIYIASVLKEKDTRSWFEELRVDMNVIKNIAMEILDFYDNYREIPGERITAAVSKLPQRL